MQKISFIFLLSIMSLASLAQKAVSLFNGKDLTGWTINGTEKWYVDKATGLRKRP